MEGLPLLNGVEIKELRSKIVMATVSLKFLSLVLFSWCYIFRCTYVRKGRTLWKGKPD